ncbi:MAG: prepilin-type N-terminal cleavage/methylation domain-containing protein [Planctomycetota bacterium]
MRRAFSLIEIMIVVVIVGILAAVALPQFAGATDEARTSAAQAAVAGVRAAIASHRTAAVISGDDPFPTLAELTDGTTISFGIPANPFNDSSSVQSVTQAQADTRAVVGTSAGWNYFVDNSSTPPAAVFYANSEAETIEDDASGQPIQANNL